jgi:NAD(P)-dependent dehydrogenase (short-subunit alcohol dehydrogenase family)
MFAAPILTDRTALVTGGGTGIGLAIAKALGAQGARVIIASRTQTHLDEGLAALASAGVAGATSAVVDVRDPASVDRLVDGAIASHGRIDILINNAALPLTTRFEGISTAEWRQAIEVNLTAPFRLIQAVVPSMKAQQYGRIVNISSTAGRMVSTLGGAHYTTSKTGLLGLTRAAAKELGRYGITVNAVCPGMIDTELTRESAAPDVLDRLAASYPVPRLGTALEVADLICFAASESAGYITGAALDINGGDLMM